MHTPASTSRVPGGAPSAAGWLARLCAILLVGVAAFSPTTRGQGPDAGQVLLVDIKGAIGFVSVAHLAKALERAQKEDATALIVRLDTPGGLLSSTREMIQAILASRVPVVVYVAPSGARAASAGTYLAYAAHVAAMAPGTHMGAATPIAMGVPGLPGSPPPGKPSGTDKPAEPDPAAAASRKSVNDAVAYIRTLAQLRNRNAEWAEKAVRDAATLTASDALKEKVIDVLAGDVDQLLAAIDGRSVTTAAGAVKLATKGRRVVEHKGDWKMEVMAVITDPNIAFILLLLGVYGILFEFWHPGAVAPGVIGGISLIVALTALSVLPLNYGGLALLLLGIALMLAEAFTPGFGLVGLGGIVAFVLGALFLFDPGETDIRIAVAWPLIAGAAAVSAAFFFGIAGVALRARRRPVRTGAEEMIGSVGEVVSWNAGGGDVRVLGELWAAKSQARLATGQRVRVTGRDGLTLLVQETT
jgi:membrane-bound serine protease (ClpP class)